MYYLFIFSVSLINVCFADYLNDGTTLEFVFLVHRHGDRTPVKETLVMCTDPDAVAAASEPYGYGQLTNLGKQRSYALGQTIRYRYNDLLSPYYNVSEIYIRSTDSTRTKMSVLAAMAAVYPALPGSWSEMINWVPTPYTTVPVKYDFNLAFNNCPIFEARFYAAMMADSSRMSRYADVMDVIAEVFNNDAVRNLPLLVYGFYDAFVSQQNLGVPLDPRIAAIMPDIKEAAGVAIDVLFGDDNYISLQAGVFLNEFFKYAEKVINCEDTPRMRVYSAHDFNVYSLMAVSQVTPRQGVPSYSSAFSLEVRKNAGGQYFVLAVYQPSPGEDLVILPIKGCSNLYCEINEFKSIVSKYLLNEDTWRTECGFTHDMDVKSDNI